MYADVLTVLLENVARIFEIHQPLVENYYGPEYLVHLAEILQGNELVFHLTCDII